MKKILCFGYLFILLLIQACGGSDGAAATAVPPSATPPVVATATPTQAVATPTAPMPIPTPPLPVDTPPPGFKVYEDTAVGVTLFIPDSWIVSYEDPGRLVILQSYPEDKYVGGEGLQPGDTKCDLSFWPDTSAANLLQQWTSDPNAAVISKQAVTLALGQPGTRLEIENRGRSLSLITEINEQAVTLVCFGEFAQFDDVALTLQAK
ncbi:hypothetical protein [Candidatus Leptofilum sp.]|uniref:hypothetical protein n=1 Tax=Candidatus Leptofilum sp. TaxID=3241576 RepID=UPI003B5BEED9